MSRQSDFQKAVARGEAEDRVFELLDPNRRSATIQALKLAVDMVELRRRYGCDYVSTASVPSWLGILVKKIFEATGLVLRFDVGAGRSPPPSIPGRRGKHRP